MELGLVLNTQEPAYYEPCRPVEECVEHTALARDAGFDLVTTGQHYLTNDLKLQTLPLLSRVAAEAGETTVGTGILLLPLHHPVEIAEQITTLDYIADRAILGVGSGYRDAEFEGFGIPKSDRGQRIEEGVEFINRLMTEEDVTYRDKHFAVENAVINPGPGEGPRLGRRGRSEGGRAGATYWRPLVRRPPDTRRYHPRAQGPLRPDLRR